MIDRRLVGTWALVATEWKRADGRHANPFGDGAVGVLTYDAAGSMSVQIMRADRPSISEGQPAGIDTAMAAAVPGYIGYFGSFDVDVDAGIVTHQVAGAAFPAWAGHDVPRRYRVDGDTLVLTDSVIAADGVAVEASTTWRRMG